jgi:hypothetical protein
MTINHLAFRRHEMSIVQLKSTPLALLPRGVMLSISSPLQLEPLLSPCRVVIFIKDLTFYVNCTTRIQYVSGVHAKKTLGGPQYNVTVKSGLVRLLSFIRLWIRSPDQKSRKFHKKEMIWEPGSPWYKSIDTITPRRRIRGSGIC